MKKVDLEVDRKVVREKIVNSNRRLLIELERCTQVGGTDFGKSNARTDINVGNPACASGKVIAQMGGSVRWSSSHRNSPVERERPPLAPRDFLRTSAQLPKHLRPYDRK